MRQHGRFLPIVLGDVESFQANYLAVPPEHSVAVREVLEMCSDV